MDSHLIGPGLTKPAAKVAAARAACLAAMLLGNARESLDEIRADLGNVASLSRDSLTGKYERLRALRKISPEAYYYWHTACSYLE